MRRLWPDLPLAFFRAQIGPCMADLLTSQNRDFRLFEIFEKIGLIGKSLGNKSLSRFKLTESYKHTFFAFFLLSLRIGWPLQDVYL